MSNREDYTDCRSCQIEGKIVDMQECGACGRLAHKHCLIECERCGNIIICTQCRYKSDDHLWVCQECITPEIVEELKERELL